MLHLCTSVPVNNFYVLLLSCRKLDVMMVLQTIISKFPEELVNAWCEVFFLPLVQRLTGDPSSQCREAVGACLRALMQRSAPQPLDKLAQYCLIWLGGGDARLARTAAQV